MAITIIGGTTLNKIRIPATTANMGPGFDTIGMALKLYNEIEFEERLEGISLTQDGKPYPIALMDNLFYTTIIRTLSKYNYKLKGLKLNLSMCQVPFSRGLGCSRDPCQYGFSLPLPTFGQRTSSGLTSGSIFKLVYQNSDENQSCYLWEFRVTTYTVQMQ